VSRASLASVCVVGVGAVAAGTVSPPLLAAGIGLLLLPGAAWALLVSSTRWVAVKRTVASCEASENVAVRLHFTVHAAWWLPVHIDVEDHRGGWRPIERGPACLELVVPRPGGYWLSPSRVRLRDPTGTFERRIAAGSPANLLILPAPRRESIARHTQFGQANEPEPQGLRSYVPGTPLTRIHWPALARGAELQVRNFAPPPCRLPLVVVDTGGVNRIEALDWLARTAAGHVLELARTGGCRVLLPGETTPMTVVGVGGDWRAVHRRLATLGTAAPSSHPGAAVSGAAVRLCATGAPGALPPARPLPHGLLPAA
jgi:uncharacterized protein (DUF58 family)